LLTDIFAAVQRFARLVRLVDNICKQHFVVILNYEIFITLPGSDDFGGGRL
jgi:hypothetical protein